MDAKYDRIGRSYSDRRQPDRRIAAIIEDALGDAQSVLNVGAGAGSYEPADRDVTALEPSAEMIRQRPPDAGPAVQGVAEDLPFDDDAFDAAMAILTIHHWSDCAKGLSELRRVARGPVVILTFDPRHGNFWLTDYIPELATLDDGTMPSMDELRSCLGDAEISPVPVPEDCTDGFLCAYWRRPFAYLDPDIRAGMSSFWAIGDVTRSLDRLRADLESGAWAERYAALERLDVCDLGYRLVVAR